MSRQESSTESVRQPPNGGQHRSQQGQQSQRTQQADHAKPDRQRHSTSGQRSATSQQHRQSHNGMGAGRRAGGGSAVPLGFRLVSVAFAGMGLLLVLSGLLVVQGASALPATAGPISSSLTIIGLLFGAFGLVNIAAGYGTWTFAPWGRRVGLALAALAAVGSLLLLMAGPAGVIGLGVHGGIAWYLHTNEQQYAALSRRS